MKPVSVLWLLLVFLLLFLAAGDIGEEVLR